MNEITREERLKETIAAAVEDRVPFDGRADGAPGDPSTTAAVAPHILTAADLTAALIPAGRWVPINAQKGVWVHQLSGQDTLSMMRWCAGLKADLDGLDNSQVAAQVNLVHIRTYQAILACRVSDEPGAARCFSRADTQAVLKYLGYSAITRICQVSDELGGAEEALGPGALAFFAHNQQLLNECAGVLSTFTGCPSGLLERLTRTLLVIGQCVKRGALASGISSEL